MEPSTSTQHLPYQSTHDSLFHSEKASIDPEKTEEIEITPCASAGNPFRRPSISFGAEPRPPRTEAIGSSSSPPGGAEKAPQCHCQEGGWRRPGRPEPLPLPPHEEPAPSPPETLSTCSSGTRFDGDGFSTVQQSDEHADEGNFKVIFKEANDPHVASHGLEVAEPLPPHDIYEGLSLEGTVDNLRAIDIQDYERYRRGYCYQLSHHRDWKNKILPGPVATSLADALPPKGWSMFVHPEGTRYFYCDHPNSPVPVITEAWLFEKELREEVERYVVAIFQFMHEKTISFRGGEAGTRPTQPSPLTGHGEGEMVWDYFQNSAPVVLVLEARLSGNFGYYFVDHTRRRLFWLDEYDFTYCAGEVHVEHTETSLGLEMMSQYWKHNELFPQLYELTSGDLVEFSDMIGFVLGDVLTSDTSAVNMYNLDQLKDVQTIMTSHGQKRPEDRRTSVGERRTLYRVIGDFYHERFLNLYGERGVRLDSKQSIHFSSDRRQKWIKQSDVTPQTIGSRPWYQRILPAFSFSKRDEDGNRMVRVDADPEPSAMAKNMHCSSFLMNAATLFMFGGPYVHANRLKEMTLDQIVNKNLLAKYTEKMVAEWRDVALYGTVLLGANVSFLTIQSVDDASKNELPRTSAQRASYFSILASLGTIVSSLVLLILVRHREVMGNKLIGIRSQSRWGLEALALMYGTPFSLVIWSILGFFISFAVLWFECKDPVVIAIVVVSLVSFAIFLGWAVSASYYEQEPYEMVAMRAAEKVLTAGTTMRRRSVHVAEKVKTAGGTVRAGTLEAAREAKRRLSSILIEPNEKRSRPQYIGHRGVRCASPERADTTSNPDSDTGNGDSQVVNLV